MPNGKGWIDCIDCINCKWSREPWERYCKEYNLLLPNLEDLEHKHTVCSKFAPVKSRDSILNSEVVANDEGAIYYIYRRSNPHHKSEDPVKLKHNILYAFHYNEQKLTPFMDLKNVTN